MPGNIHYGYVGTAAGFYPIELHGGASYAEITDPAHEEILKLLGRWFINIQIDIECLINLEIRRYVNFRWWRTGFDDPTDYSAGQLGIDLYNSASYPVSARLLGNFIGARSGSLPHMPDPSYSLFNEKWPYPVGTFDGGG